MIWIVQLPGTGIHLQASAESCTSMEKGNYSPPQLFKKAIALYIQNSQEHGKGNLLLAVFFGYKHMQKWNINLVMSLH